LPWQIGAFSTQRSVSRFATVPESTVIALPAAPLALALRVIACRRHA
jgi:hypothetical protein